MKWLVMEDFDETNNKKKTFINNLEDINLPKLGFVRDDRELYYIYKDAKEFVEIKANTAREALSQSDVEKPFMVVRVQNGSLSVVDETMLKNVEIEHVESNQAEIEETDKQVTKDTETQDVEDSKEAVEEKQEFGESEEPKKEENIDSQDLKDPKEPEEEKESPNSEEPENPPSEAKE